MRRHPLVSASLRETSFLCLSHYLERERERETKSCRMDMQQKCCNNNTRRSLPASPDTIRYYLYTFHPPPDRPTDPQRPRDVQKRIRQIRHHHHHHPHSHTENQCKIHQLHQYLPDFSPADTRDLPDPTLSHLTLHFFWIPPKNEKLPHCSIHPFIHPSIREDRSRRHQLTISKKKLPEKLYYLLPEGS